MSKSFAAELKERKEKIEKEKTEQLRKQLNRMGELSATIDTKKCREAYLDNMAAGYSWAPFHCKSQEEFFHNVDGPRLSSVFAKRNPHFEVKCGDYYGGKGYPCSVTLKSSKFQ